jgi:hypothetical protein
MKDLQLDINNIVSSLTRQISEQAQKIAVLEATVDALNNELDSIEQSTDED